MEVEDDLFFADLNKQISLLVMDEDEDPVASTYPSVSFQASSRATYVAAPAPAPAPAPFYYEQSCRRESKGTGVFIPQSSQPRRKHRQGRFSSCNSKSHRQQQDKTARTVSYHQASYNNSFNTKKVLRTDIIYLP